MKKQSVLAALLKSGAWCILFLVCQVGASMGVSILLGILSVFVPGLDGDPFTTLSRFTYEIMLLSALIYLGIAALICGKKLPRTCGLKKTKTSAVAAGFFFGFASFTAAIFLIAFASQIPAYSQAQESYAQDMEGMIQAGAALWAEMLYVCLVGPFLEELLFRGLVQGTLRKSMKGGVAVFLSALFFALFHGNLYQMVFTLPLGLVLGYLALRFDSLWPSFALHVAFNFSNYPTRISMALGFGEESDVTVFLYYAVVLFGLVGLILGFICLNRAREAVPYSDTQQGGNMAAPEYLIVGLGNPGTQYAASRHNAGFTALEYIAMKENVSVRDLRFRSLTGEMILGQKKILLLKPQTYMNLSGEAVREAAAFYRIPPERILVLFDDIHFAPGVLRIRPSGSAGGHNGIKSIIAALGSEAFPRVKIGVGTPPEGWELMNWVLASPPPADQKRILAALEDVYRAALLFVEGQLERAESLYNGKMHE